MAVRSHLTIPDKAEFLSVVLADKQSTFLMGDTAPTDQPVYFYWYDANSMEIDNGTTVLKPDAILPGNPGRYLRMYIAQLQPDWAQGTSSAQDYIKNKPSLATVATTGNYNDLSGKPTIPSGQVNSDWNSASGLSQILNKPTLSTVATTGAYADLSGKPSLATVATSGSYNDLSSKPTIPAAQIQSDWSQASSGSLDFIKNKPSIPAAQVNSDWNSGSGVSQILNKPTITTPVNADWNANSGLAQILNKPSLTPPGATSFAAYGTGTAYTLTTSSSQIVFGTTSPSITLTSAGTYLLISNVTIEYVGLTTLSVNSANFKIRRTNNTAADVANTSQNFNVPLLTLATATGGDADIPAVLYTTSNTNDILQLWGNRGSLSVGSIQISNGYLLAIKLY